MTLQTSLNTPMLATGSATASIVIGGESGSGGSGSSSTAVGYNTTALGDGSVAMGLNATTSGAGSIVIGTGAAVPSSNSIAIGPTATASGNESVAIGVGGTALGDFSTVIGIHSNAGTSGQQNIWTLGHNATNTIPGSMLLGGNTGSTPLNLIWNDHAADLGSSSQPFGSFYINNIVQDTPSTTTAFINSPFTQILNGSAEQLVSPTAHFLLLGNPNNDFLANPLLGTTFLQYTGVSSRWFDVSFMVSCTTTIIGTPNIKLWLTYNATIGTPTDVFCVFNSSNSTTTTQSLRKVIQLATNDYVGIAIETDTSGTYQFDTCSITATQI